MHIHINIYTDIFTFKYIPICDIAWCETPRYTRNTVFSIRQGVPFSPGGPSRPALPAAPLVPFSPGSPLQIQIKTNNLSNQHENIQLNFSPNVCVWLVLLPYRPVLHNLKGPSVFLLKITPGPFGLKCPIMTACEPGITYKYTLLPCGFIASHVEVLFLYLIEHIQRNFLFLYQIPSNTKKKLYIDENK